MAEKSQDAGLDDEKASEDQTPAEAKDKRPLRGGGGRTKRAGAKASDDAGKPEVVPVPDVRQTPLDSSDQDTEPEMPSQGQFPVVGVGASAGGLEASTELLRNLPVDTGMAFVFVHHLAPEHNSLLVEILARATSMPVSFAEDCLQMEPNHVYVAPPDSFVAVFHGTLNLMRQEERGPRTAVDYFLLSLAEDMRNLAVGVILSGTGSDGTLGIKAIKAEDGLTFTQDPETAAYDGMPRSAIDTGTIDFVLAPQLIAEELARVAKHPYFRPERKPLPEAAPESEARVLERIFLMLRESAGVDFTYYKPTTIRRRISRRMVVHHFENLGEYVKYLETHTDEVKALYQDLLISVTGFFREPDSFEALKTDVFPRLLEGRSPLDTIRIWVPGCSTGEEPYSIAIALLEFLDTQVVKPPIQVFATDVSDSAIDKARQGVYPENIASEISAGRLTRFFTSAEGGYQINKAIRDICVFAKHDVTRDPPFSRLDLISCRNLLIYLGSFLQRRLMPVFHYALKSDGFLVLGSSESVGEFTNLFTLVNQKYKVYAKKPVAVRLPLEFGFRQYPIADVPGPIPEAEPLTRSHVLNVQKEADRVAIEKYVPPGVLVGKDLEILQFRGDTSAYLRHNPGRASLNVLDMARQGLDTALKAQLISSMDARKTARIEGVQVQQNGSFRTTDIEVIPVRTAGETYYLIFFKEPSVPVDVATLAHKRSRKAASPDPATEQLSRELTQTRDQLRMTVEEKDASLEELRAANEEIQSSNEELQSINEELETAKEELQSSNEELTTLNEELQNRNFELLSTNDDFRNVLASVNVPIIILGKDMRIRRYTPTAERVLNLIPSDIGRPITDLKMKIDVPDLHDLIVQVLQTLSVAEREVRDESGHRYHLQIRPYRTSEDKIEGVVLVMLDVEALRAGEKG